jgi:hypothetical protein
MSKGTVYVRNPIVYRILSFRIQMETEPLGNTCLPIHLYTVYTLSEKSERFRVSTYLPELAATRDPCHETAAGSRGLARAGGAQLITSLGESEIVAPMCVGVSMWGGALSMSAFASHVLPARCSTRAVALHASRSACAERRVLSSRASRSDVMRAMASATGPPAPRVCVGVLVMITGMCVGSTACLRAFASAITSIT